MNRATNVSLAASVTGTHQASTAGAVGSAALDDVLGWLGSSADGLSRTEAAARLARYGPNAVRTHGVSALAVLGRQLRSALL
ncbi:MAG: cation-transporting P-type ATPase, partial [Mycobacterium sp.]